MAHPFPLCPPLPKQNVCGDMLVEYISPITALLLALFFAGNIGFSFGEPFRNKGIVVGGETFYVNLQHKLFMNFLAQFGPEIVSDIVCIAAERYFWMGEEADR